MVDILWEGSLRASTIMSLVHYLSLLAAHHSCSLTASPVTGRSNLIAESPSSFSVSAFSLASPPADSIPTQIPQQLFLGFGTSLSDKCLFYLTQVLVAPGKFMLLPSTTSCTSVFRTIAYLSPSGSALPASEDVLV